MKHAFYTACLCCLAFVTAYGQLQDAEEIRKLVNDVHAGDSGFYVEVPFEYNGEIIIRAEVAGEAYNFLFDTGGYTMIDAAVQQKNNFTVLGKQLLNSTNGLSKETDILYAGTFDIGGLLFDHVKAYCIELDNSPKLQCMVNGGIIGSAIIHNHIWQIDYPNRKIIITDSLEKLPGMESAVRIPVYLNPNLQPYFMSKVNGRSQWLMFDTGCASPLWMGDKDAQKVIGDAKKTRIIGASVETHHGRVSDTLNAFSADCEINGLTFKEIPAYYRDGSGLTLFGNPVIKDYIVTLNFGEGEMYFKPIEAQSAPIGWESFGFTLEYEGGNCKIATVIEGTEAQKSGLRPGDVVTAINGKKITCTDFCSCFATFYELQEKSYDITLSVLKNDKPKQVKLKKTRVF
ncbi:aspartyl protease family protein [Flavobacterium sp. MFBS3-15]|uniref:aspartyl protease family protein n=1 Tax=Flavobacterium sp. MFBS3-15 TaxID=2989816 RepID=UPI00223623B2|nr:aspartyl protease family protein [Flavobacterium sp. MFBS3-15]MCW4469358.1 aspartyl protease family protein [Flavobacterium sp. MFBS3-15]